MITEPDIAVPTSVFPIVELLPGYLRCSLPSSFQTLHHPKMTPICSPVVSTFPYFISSTSSWPYQTRCPLHRYLLQAV